MFLKGLIAAGFKSSEPLHLLRLNGRVERHPYISTDSLFTAKFTLCNVGVASSCNLKFYHLLPISHFLNAICEHFLQQVSHYSHFH